MGVHSDLHSSIRQPTIKLYAKLHDVFKHAGRKMVSFTNDIHVFRATEGSILECAMYHICLSECRKMPPVLKFGIKNKAGCAFMKFFVCVVFSNRSSCAFQHREK